MRTGSICLGLSFAVLGAGGCSDTSGPSYMELDIVVDWPKLDEEGFVGDEYHFFGNCDLQNDLSLRCETFARGSIPVDWDGRVRVTVTCPIGENTHSFQVSGYYEARGDEFGVCSGRIFPVCTEGPQLLTVEEMPGYNGEPQPECLPPE